MSRLFPFFSVLAQGTISDLVCQIFDIKYDFFGGVVSNMAKVWIVLVVKHMKLCFLSHIDKTDVSEPFECINWRSGLKCYIRRILVQTLLGARPGLEIQPRYETSVDLQVDKRSD